MSLAAVEASLALAAERGGDLTPAVYARLFARLPQMEAEFWRDRSGAIRGEMLARVFEVILDLAGPRAYAEQMIGTEYVTHDAYGIPRALFPVFFAVVAEAVEAACGDGWTPAMADGWAALLADIDAMLGKLAA
ncbi:MAG: globin [Alphaproteobacteria bacterium PA4]|nr:MAG: globin [Alphaproteobacteria bacterium PA4]